MPAARIAHLSSDGDETMLAAAAAAAAAAVSGVGLEKTAVAETSACGGPSAESSGQGSPPLTAPSRSNSMWSVERTVRDGCRLCLLEEEGCSSSGLGCRLRLAPPLWLQRRGRSPADLTFGGVRSQHRGPLGLEASGNGPSTMLPRLWPWLVGTRGPDPG